MRAQAIRKAKTGLLDDEELQQLISERFDEDSSFWTGTGKHRMEILVEVSDGQVTLRGTVRSAIDRRRADILARSLGAAGVDNRLVISENPAPSKPRRLA